MTAAKMLGIGKSTMYRKIAGYGIANGTNLISLSVR
ncbi:hypothetical protein [Paenibacillus polymyxa]